MAATSSPDLALHIVRVLQDAGHTAYFAGGCVRDQLMGRTPADYDVATSARPQEVLGLFPRSQKVGMAFGVVLVRQRHEAVEVATFRSDGHYGDGRRPDTVTFTTAEQDAQRRDFTCNGLFWDPVARNLHDFVGGQKDIEAKMLRAIGEPAARFGEDHLRLLRAVRFAGKLRFCIEAKTFEAIGALAANIKSISRERIGEEVRMIVEHPTRAAGAKLLDQSGLLANIWPAELLPQTCQDAPPLEFPRLAGLPLATMRSTALVAMQLDLAPAADWMAAAEHLRHAFLLTNVETQDIPWLGEKLAVLLEWQGQSTAGLKRLLADGRWAALESLFRAEPRSGDISAFDARLAELRRDPIGPPPLVSGEDLIALGAAPGPQFKRWLEVLYDRQLENEFPDRAHALEAARQLVTR